MYDKETTIKLAADLFVSDLLVGKMIGSRLIRLLTDRQMIHNHRDLFDSVQSLARAVNDNRFSETDNRKLLSLSKLVVDRNRYIEKAEACLRDGIRSVSVVEDDYPVSMQNLDGMPIILYYKGNEKLMNKQGNCVAVVGSRKPSNYGLRATNAIVKDLCLRGTVIISGLARGIDTAAHRAALNGNGKTIAVTACGLDMVYPPENKDLFDEIADKGLLVSEMPPGQEAIRRYFPARNRIMSAVSDVVAIMEAGEFSGTLHTASFAVAQGRDVFVLPGSIYSTYCKGNLMLLRDGADILLCAEDIISRLSGAVFGRQLDEIRSELRKNEIRELLPEHPEKLKREELSSLIFDELSNEDQTLDELISSTSIPFSIIAPLISELVLCGAINESGERFALTFPYT
ncbi:MAG: DNA-processing protein DprA [Clostridiales bacterium]|nr:DNA-processing protein DprA [Clostridiales bacterium]